MTFDEGNTLYALIWRKTDDKINIAGTNNFETYVEANIATYDHPLTNQGDGVGGFSDYYSVDFPVVITGTEPVAYRVQIMLQPGTIDADADFGIAQGEIIWNGSKEIDLGELFNSNQTTLNRYNETSITIIDETETI